MKTVLIFVMGSSNGPYPKLMQASRETWDSVDLHGAPTWYYSNILQEKPEHTIQFPGGIGIHKEGEIDLLAFAWALKQPWDYMARVNASCYVRKTVLLDHIQSLPEKNVMRGVIAPKGDGTMFMWGGAHYIMSRDVIQAIVDNKDKWDHREMEDVALSRLTEALGIPHDGNGRACSINQRDGGWMCFTYNSSAGGGFEFKDFQEFKSRAQDQFFIRVKQDGEREKDIWIMHELWDAGLR